MTDICRFSGSPVFAPGTSELLVGAAVYVYLAGTTTPATVYQDYGASTPHAFPILVGSDGLIPAIYWGSGTFRIRVNVSSVDNSPVWDFDGIKGEVVVTGGGGGGGTTPPDEQLIKTGALRLEFADAPLTGYVRANGRTIGSASSGATERANADTQSLFTYGWNNWSDSICSVVGGRGANASSDWAANKQLSLPNARGASLVGLDTMGNAAAGAIQALTTVTATNASTAATVADASKIYRGMYLVSTKFPLGTKVTAVSGLNITLSQAATSSGADTGARFSALLDAQLPAAVGGSVFNALNSAENGPHTHTFTTGNNNTNHQHDTIFSYKGADLTTGASTHAVLLANSTGSVGSATITSGNDKTNHTHPGTTDSTGSGNPVGVVQPSIGVTIYIKL